PLELPAEVRSHERLPGAIEHDLVGPETGHRSGEPERAAPVLRCNEDAQARGLVGRLAGRELLREPWPLWLRLPGRHPVRSHDDHAPESGRHLLGLLARHLGALPGAVPSPPELALVEKEPAPELANGIHPRCLLSFPSCRHRRLPSPTPASIRRS